MGFLVARTTAVERALLFVAAPTMIVPEFYTDLAGRLLFAAIIARQVIRARTTAVSHASRRGAKTGVES